MKKFSFYQLFWIFIIGSVFGWLVEVLYAYATLGHFVNHSALIYGPFGMAYGIGAVALTLLLSHFQESSNIKIFLISFICGTVAEYIMSWGMELVLGFSDWDYSNNFLNINGRVCLLYSLFWGILGIVWVRCLYPLLERIIDNIPRMMGNYMMYGLLVFLSLNSFISFTAVNRQKQRSHDIQPKNRFDEFLDHHYDDEFLERVYPGIKGKNR